VNLIASRGRYNCPYGYSNQGNVLEPAHTTQTGINPLLVGKV